jgi:membrane protease YdiL (CAAX protease family)
MEEGLFRGVMIRLFRVRLSFWRANWLQAFLFGIWHLPWVLKYYQMGTIKTTGEILFAVFSNSVPQLLMGLIWGYLFLKTSNLWAPWAAHVLTNSVGNLLHITSLNGLDSGFALRMSIYTVVAMLCMFLVKHLAKKNRMSEVKPWGEWTSP